MISSLISLPYLKVSFSGFICKHVLHFICIYILQVVLWIFCNTNTHAILFVTVVEIKSLRWISYFKTTYIDIYMWDETSRDEISSGTKRLGTKHPGKKHPRDEREMVRNIQLVWGGYRYVGWGDVDGVGGVVCLFVLRLNVPVNNFSVMSGRSHHFLGN